MNTKETIVIAGTCALTAFVVAKKAIEIIATRKRVEEMAKAVSEYKKFEYDKFEYDKFEYDKFTDEQ